MDATSKLQMIRSLAWQHWHHMPAGVSIDDIVQEASLAVVEALPRYVPGGAASLDTYLWQRISGAISDFARREDPLTRRQRLGGLMYTHVEGAAQDIEDWSTCPLIRAAGAELRAGILRAVANLPEQERAVFVRVHVSGDRQTEIAADYRLHPSRIWQILRMAHKRLRRALQQHALDNGLTAH